MLAFWDWRRPNADAPGRMPKAFTDETVDGEQNPLFSARINPVALQQAAEPGLVRRELRRSEAREELATL